MSVMVVLGLLLAMAGARYPPPTRARLTTQGIWTCHGFIPLL
jgi:hypothetical protein